MRDKQLYLILHNERQMQCIRKGDHWVNTSSYFALALPLQKHFFYCQHPQLKKDDIVCKQCRENTGKCVNRWGRYCLMSLRKVRQNAPSAGTQTYQTVESWQYTGGQGCYQGGPQQTEDMRWHKPHKGRSKVLHQSLHQYRLDAKWIGRSFGGKDMEDPSRQQDVHETVMCPCSKEIQPHTVTY